MKNTILNIILPISFISLICSCGSNKTESTNRDKFDKVKWLTKEGEDYPARNNMLNDLVYKVKLKGLQKDSIIEMLGEPNRTDNDYFFYEISRKRLSGMTLNAKTLVIKFLNDTVEWRKIKE